MSEEKKTSPPDSHVTSRFFDELVATGIFKGTEKKLSSYEQEILKQRAFAMAVQLERLADGVNELEPSEKQKLFEELGRLKGMKIDD